MNQLLEFLTRRRRPSALPAPARPAYTAEEIRQMGRRESPEDFGKLVMPRVQTLVSTDKNGAVKTMRPSKDAIERIFTDVESDPLAGMGMFTKRQIAADKIMQILNTSELPAGQPAGSAAPLFTEPKQNGTKADEKTPGTA